MEIHRLQITLILSLLFLATAEATTLCTTQAQQVAERSSTKLDALRPAIELAKSHYQMQGSFKTQAMSRDGRVRFENEMHLSEAQRAEYRVNIMNGTVYDAKGNLYDTRSGRAWTDPRESTAIFVMDEQGHFYSSTYRKLNRFHHSTLLNGNPAASAGEWVVVDGVILEYRDRSGHYPQGRDFSSQGLAALEQSGAELEEILLSFH